MRDVEARRRALNDGRPAMMNSLKMNCARVLKYENCSGVTAALPSPILPEGIQLTRGMGKRLLPTPKVLRCGSDW